MQRFAYLERYDRYRDLSRHESRAGVADSEADEGFRRLAAATVWRAIEDARGDDVQVAYSAVRWLAGETTEGLTLESCCQLLDADPDTVRNNLIRHFATVRTRMTQYRKVRILAEPTVVDKAM